MSDEPGAVQDLVLQIDREMSAKSFKYFFTEMLGFDYSHHHQSWEQGLNGNKYYCVKASRDHGSLCSSCPMRFGLPHSNLRHTS